MRWVEFWDSFECAVHSNKRLTNIEKFNYLKAKLHGDAAHAISGISLSNDNYIVAIKILQERFGKTQEVIDLHYNALINLQNSDNTTKGLRCFLDKIAKHLRCLQVLKQEIDQAVFVSIIKSKLPKEVLLPLEIQLGTAKEWTTSDLTESLSAYVSARKRSEGSISVQSGAQSNESKERQKTKTTHSDSRNGKPRQSNVTSGEALVANTKSDRDYYNLWDNNGT